MSRNRLFYFLFLVCAVGLVVVEDAVAATTYKIDINSKQLSSSSSIASYVTEPGFTGLDLAGNANGDSVTVDGVTFEIFAVDGGHRFRGSEASPDPNAINADFVYENGEDAGMGVKLGGAGDLQVGTWEVEVYIWDASEVLGDHQISIEELETAVDNVYSTTVSPVASGPAFTFQFESDGVTSYRLISREHNEANTVRLNGFTLTLVPEPSACVLLTLATVGMLVNPVRRKRMS